MMSRFIFLCWLLLGILLTAPSTYAQSVGAPSNEQCRGLSAQQLVDKARAASTATQSTGRLSVLPGGAMTTVKIPVVAPPNSIYCAEFVEDNAHVQVVTAISRAGQETELTLALPDVGFGRQKQRDLVLVSFPLNSGGQLTLDSPGVSLTQKVWVSNRLYSSFWAVVAVMLAYLIAVLALGRVGERYSFNPVYLASGKSDRASLSQFQVLGFTLLVLGLLVFVLFRTSVLSDISSDILLLLGISAGGTVGSKVAGVMKSRLSFDNWAWLRNQGWLTAYEKGVGQAANPGRARWGDLLKTSGNFDVYSFQLGTVSLLVGFALLTSDLSALATFSLPTNLLALLGLSNVVYIGGKAVAPNSVGELDEKVTALRNAERDWVAKVITVVTPLPDPQDKRQAARATAPDQYEVYITAAREAARMLKSLYGAEGTKFAMEPITDTELMPVFP